jgi:glutathione S-transferase
MKLIGQYDSPFTRRVGITMTLYGLAFEHSKLSVFSNSDELAAINPLIRVPTLVLDSGEVLVETSAIIDYLDTCVPPDKRLLPQIQPDRYRAQQVVSLASGVSDLAVRLFYERRLHQTPSPEYVARLTRQITQTLSAINQSAPPPAPMTQAHIAVTCMYRHLSEAHPSLTETGRYPGIEQLCAVHEAMLIFKAISQAFIAPA